MKLHNSPACESSGTRVRGWLRLGSEETSERLYWVFSPDLLFAARPSFGVHFVYEGINPAFELRLGISSEDIREMDVSNCLGRDDARAVSEALRACLAEGTEVRIRHRLAFGGQRQNMETTIVPIMDAAAGGVVG